MTHTRTRVMGILNVTEDSFSDGGCYINHEQAIEHALRMHEQGADIIDIGGESTRPGAVRVTEQEELDRVIPVIEALAERGIITSVDTMRASVAQEAARAGVHYLNDVSGGLADPNMYSVAAQIGLPIILMHWRAQTFGNAAGSAHEPAHIIEDIKKDFHSILDNAHAAGIKKENIILDPGIGFAKDAESNWAILRGLKELEELGYPLLIGHSRKRFLQALLPENPNPLAADYPTTSLTTLLALQGVWAVRVHNILAARSTMNLIEAFNHGR